MRKFFVTAFALGAILALATSGYALERSQARITGDDLGDWNAGSTTCSVAYYNICTGYIWVSTGFPAGWIVGTAFDACCDGGQLTESILYYRTGVPAGYGFTGEINVYAADANDAPMGAALATQSILPVHRWNFSTWANVNVPGRFLILHTLNDDQAFGRPDGVVTDGAGGGCGLCFPITRGTNSYTYGTNTAPAPPSPFFIAGCYTEMLAVAQLVGCPVSVEDESWGSIKNLYR
jgi:hypothetical protein